MEPNTNNDVPATGADETTDTAATPTEGEQTAETTEETPATEGASENM